MHRSVAEAFPIKANGNPYITRLSDYREQSAGREPGSLCLRRVWLEDSGRKWNGVDQGKAITAIVAGSLLIGASFFFKNFYEAKGIPLPIASGRRVPTWQGRLIFWVVGGMMVLGGLISFFPNR